MEEKERLDVPDIMKGICIILVVMQHCRWLPDADACVLTRVYLCMNMPLFFFASGLFLPLGRNLRGVAAHSGRRLLVPWLLFAIASGLMMSVFEEPPRIAPVDFYTWLFVGPNVPLYFLRALFMALLIVVPLARICRSFARRAVAFVLFCAVSWAVVSYRGSLVLDNAGCWEALSMAMYMWLGYMCSGLLKIKRLTPPIALVAFLAALAAACLLQPGRMRWHYQQTAETWAVITICALLGILSLWALACLLHRCRPLAALGRRTMAVLVLHYPLLVLSVALTGLGRPVAGIAMLAALPPAIYLCERYVPFVFGEKVRRWKRKDALTI